MPGLTSPLSGDALLEAVSDSMAALHERYHHRRPARTKTQLLDDELLVCLMGGVYTDVEKTMIEIQRHGLVKDMRSEFQNAMQDRFISEVERLSGRKVVSFISNTHVGPDLEIELFMLAPKLWRSETGSEGGYRA